MNQKQFIYVWIFCPPISKIMIDGIEYDLNITSSNSFNFGDTTSLFTDGQSYNIEFI